MKISKLILACVLSGIVGNVFAEPVVIACKFDDVKKKPEIEFDDNISNQITVNGKSLPYNYSEDQAEGSIKLVEFNASTISWINEEKANGLNFSLFYKINRKTGRITYEFKSDTRHNVYRGTCMKMANNGF